MHCETCLGFDVRSLLHQATSDTFKLPDGSHSAIDKFHKHQAGLSALKASSENGCEFCALLWDTAVKTIGKEQVTRWLEKGKGEGEQDIYLGTSAWSADLQGLPYVVATQQPSQQGPWAGSRTLGSFEVYANRDSIPPDGDNILARNVYQDPSSDECLAVASEWLQTCLKNHKACARSHKHQLPTRVIDVGPPDGSKKPYVFITNGRYDDWAALSYCWGGNSSFVLKKDSIKLYKQETSHEHFPETIRDAIVITRKLNLRYLWVDALCIIQDSKDDWEYEAARMRDVYKNALVTIAAADSPTSSSGILHERTPLRPTCELSWSPSGDQHVFLRSGLQLWDNMLQSSKLNTRGWTLQEALLAPRTLSFGQQQMYWECPTCQMDEGGRTTKPAQDYRSKRFLQDMVRSKGGNGFNPFRGLFGSSRPSPSSAGPYDRWYDIVFQYTGRHLTNDTDMLPALSGLANEFQRLTGDRYLAGLWQKDLIRGLLWDRFPLWAGEVNGDFDEKKPSAYRAPSWSWASVNGQHVSITGHGNVPRPGIIEKEAKVIKVDIMPSSSDPFGQSIGGSLTLKAPFQEIGDFRNGTAISGSSPKLDAMVRRWWKDIKAFRYVYQQAHQDERDPQHFGLVQVVRWSASPGSQVPGIEFLLLESTGKKDEYRRIWHPQLRKMQVPKEDVSTELYKGTKDEMEAWEEVEMNKWKVKTLTIV